ncbi:hypothetical protein O4H25_13810, partial [Staphylococcus equorum]|uniref:hypothetical protein n=1 Tax=Staphylococcus equorum TaxID=246432 RepID=UPI0022AE9A6A
MKPEWPQLSDNPDRQLLGGNSRACRSLSRSQAQQHLSIHREVRWVAISIRHKAPKASISASSIN